MRSIAAWLLAALIVSACGASRTEAPPTYAETVIALVAGRVQAAPEAMPIADGVVVLRKGLITDVGRRGEVRVPPEATVIDCAGATVTAGFWNSHAHFIQTTWRDAATAPAEHLTAALRAMLTSYGVVRVLDTGSEQANTEALRRRIESGEVLGPMIMMAAGSIVPVGGSPYYILPYRWSLTFCHL